MSSAKENIPGFEGLVNKIADGSHRQLDRLVKSRAIDERVCVWPDGDWCYECDLSEMTHKSDDFQYMPAQFFFIDDGI